MDFLICYVLVVYGLSNMLVYFNGPFGIIDKFRNWISKIHPTFEELFSCMFCLPTNIGMLLSLLSLVIDIPFTPFTLLFLGYDGFMTIITVIFDGLLAGATTYLIHTIQNRIENGRC